MIPLRIAGRILREGGVVAYPTEGVFGLGCRPDDADAVACILEIKGRDAAQGLLLIAADRAQLEGWADLPPGTPDLRCPDDAPVTWVVPATDAVPPWIRGRHAGLAVRVTSHPVARALCEAAGLPLVSTSANRAGQPPARNALVLRRRFGSLVDFVVPGHCGRARGPSEIRDLESGKTIRPA